MRVPSFILLIVFMALIILGFENKCYSADAPVVSSVYTEQSDPNGISVKDVYDILLQTKDDKALIYEKVIDWLLASIAVVTGISGIIAAAVIFWFQRQNDKLDKRINDINKHVNDLQLRESNIEKAQNDISTTQKEIDLILKSDEFKQKLIDLESTISKLDEIEKQWEAKNDILSIAEFEQKETFYKWLISIWDRINNRLIPELIKTDMLNQSEISHEIITNSLKEPYKTLFIDVHIMINLTAKGILPHGTLTFESVSLRDMIGAYNKATAIEKATLDQLLS